MLQLENTERFFFFLNKNKYEHTENPSQNPS